MSLHSELPEINLKELADLCKVTPDGCLVELGVYRGGSAWRINQEARGRTLHLFDTFTGIPEKSEIDQFQVGAFGEVDLAAVRAALPHAVFHVGMFPGTLPPDLKDIAFSHIDCDQYESCKQAIERLWPLTVQGGIMAFDDFPFRGIEKAITDAFGTGILWTPCRIPYVVRGIHELNV